MALVQKSFSEIITFSRASNATRFAPDGVLQYAPHNLLLQSQTFDNASWTKVAATVTANATAAPDGSVTADKLVENAANAYHYILQTSTTTSNTPLTYSVYAKAAERNFINIQLGGSFTNQGVSVNLTTGQKLEYNSPTATSVTSVGNGWWRISISAATSGISPALLILPCSTLSSNPIYTGDGTSGVFIWGAQLAVGPYPLDYTPTTTAVVYGPRFDYNPTTLAPLGLLIEEQRTNSIRNNTMVGAVAGTPGTAPTNWVVSGTDSGITRDIVGIGVESGIAYIDVRFYGTPSAGTNRTINFEAANGIAATSGQTWTGSAYIALVGGSLSGTTVTFSLLETNGSSGVVNNDKAITPTAGALSGKRDSLTATLSGGGTVTNIQPRIRIGYTVGTPIDITLRIGLPQLELGAFATSVIPTATAAVTRSADIASVNTLSPWYNAAEGTFFSEGSTLKTSGAAPLLIAQVSGGSDRHQVGVYTSTAATVVGGVVQALIGANTSPAIKVAYAYKVNDFAVSNNGGSVATDTSGSVPSGLTYLAIGKFDFGGGESLSGYIRRIAYYNRRLTDAELQVLTS